MTEFVSAIIGPVVESLMVPVKKHMGYLFLSTKRVRNTSVRMKQLEGIFDDIKNHKDINDINTLEIPARVPGWLEEVLKIKSDVETISSNENRCFNIKVRYQKGRHAWKTTKEIERLLQEGREISWTDAQKPLGRVYTRSTSMSAPSSGGIGEDFNSRNTTFKDALKFLQQDKKIHVIALCGMGGVGKTMMMKQLKKTVKDKKMFDWIVKVDIGKQPNWHSIQQAVAENLGPPLTEEIETTRADRLHKRFEETSKKSEKGILVILDDVWEKVELGYVGLSPFPNGVKLLLTSRNEDFCRTIAVKGNLDLEVLKVDVLEDEEAHNFFCKITKISKESDPELYQIGGDIVKKCSCLPLAITLIAPTLISEEKSIWKATLGRLRNKDLYQNVHESIKISYDYLIDQENKEIFFLCGLFPENSNISIEDLTRFAWGLNLINGVSTVEDGRNTIKTCVRNLRKAHLLIDGDYRGCVKMHDLVLAFVLATISKGGYASIINHGDMSNWSTEDISESCKITSLTCRGMCEFPEGFKYPNLSLLKLMHGDDSFKFPQGFYENMEKLKVIAYENMQYPLLPRSLQFSTNLRVLYLHECSLMFDISFIGDLSNLQVLSITKCNIQKLPSTIGNLKELKVLDLTGCIDLIIDDGILKRLLKLEELYIIVSYRHVNVKFTNVNVDELVGCSKNLIALAIRFNALPKNISFKKLERFNISLGCKFNRGNVPSRYKFENTLKLVTDKCNILESRMTELFEKTEVLHLQGQGVNDFGDGLSDSLHHHRSFFYSLRVLDICKCADLRYLFTIHVANGLTKLERLKISSCPVLKTLIDGDKDGVGVIKFQALKFLSLGKLLKLKSLCNTTDVIELPQLMELHLNGLPKFRSIYPLARSSMLSTISKRQSFLKEEVMIPKLEKLHIHNMKNLREIWPCQFGSNKEVNVCMLRELGVDGCDSLVNMFPSNPMSLLYHLEKLSVANCGSIEVIFNIDFGFVGKIEEASSFLRSIHLWKVKNLREIWRIKGANDIGLTFCGFQAIENLEIGNCNKFRNVFSPTTINFDMRALTKINMHDCGETGIDNEMDKSIQEQEIHDISTEEISEVSDTISNVAFPSYLLHTCHNLHTLCIENPSGVDVKVVFEIESPSSEELTITPLNTQQPPLLPYLKNLELRKMECMSHVWKCNWNKFLISQKQQPKLSSSFHNLTTISLKKCKNIEYLFSPLMAKLLSNLKTITLDKCDVIEEVVSNRDDEDEGRVPSTLTNTCLNLFPHLVKLYLFELPNLKRIGGGATKDGTNEFSNNTITSSSIHDQLTVPQVNDVAWSLCQYSRKIKVYTCEELTYVIPSHALGQMQKLENLTIECCKSLVEVFETQGINTIAGTVGGNDATMVIQRMKGINVPQVSNLKKLVINDCDLLQYVFTFATLKSLMQLEKLRIYDCKAIKVVVKEENGEQKMASNVVVFPRLKSIALRRLPNLTGFFTGKNEFRWPLLDDVMIDVCPQMMVFTSGLSIARNLKYIHTELGKHSLEGLHEIPFSSLETTNSCTNTSQRIPWSFHNLVEMDVKFNYDVKTIIPSNKLLQVQKLENIYVQNCFQLEEVFEELEGTYDNELEYVVVKVPKLRNVKLNYLANLKYIWKINPWMALEFPCLTKVSIFYCNSLEHVFSSSMVGSLLQLQDLHIHDCRKIEVIVKEANVVAEEQRDAKTNEIILLPRLKSLKLEDLPNLKGFCFGKEVFSWPSLDTLKIKGCNAIRVFTMGHSTTPELKVIDTSFGRCELVMEEDLNCFINTKQQEGLQL